MAAQRCQDIQAEMGENGGSNGPAVSEGETKHHAGTAAGLEARVAAADRWHDEMASCWGDPSKGPQTISIP